MGKPSEQHLYEATRGSHASTELQTCHTQCRDIAPPWHQTEIDFCCRDSPAQHNCRMDRATRRERKLSIKSAEVAAESSFSRAPQSFEQPRCHFCECQEMGGVDRDAARFAVDERRCLDKVNPSPHRHLFQSFSESKCCRRDLPTVPPNEEEWWEGKCRVLLRQCGPLASSTPACESSQWKGAIARE